jgi:hypothetical protein
MTNQFEEASDIPTFSNVEEDLKPKEGNREEWLTRAVVELSGLFKRKGLDLPTNIVVSCGWPRGGSISNRIGECWPAEQSAGNRFEIFISPNLSEVLGPSGVLSILVHELVHVQVGLEAGHKGPFKQTMKIIGLEGKATATVAGVDLLNELEVVAKTLGKYSHVTLNLKYRSEKEKINKIVKLCCPDCDYVVRVKRTLFEERGAPICPMHRVKFEEAKIEEIKDVEEDVK